MHLKIVNARETILNCFGPSKHFAQNSYLHLLEIVFEYLPKHELNIDFSIYRLVSQR